MTNLRFLWIRGDFSDYFEKILRFIHVPQFENLDTVQLSFLPYNIRVVATDGLGHTFEFARLSGDDPEFHPLRHFGAVITTLRFDRKTTTEQLDDEPELYNLFRSFDAVEVLEFDGTVADRFQIALTITGVFPGLRIIRVAVSRHGCERTLRPLTIASKRRMMEGNPFTTIEPLLAEGEDGLDQSLRVEWEECWKAEDIQNFLSK